MPEREADAPAQPLPDALDLEKRLPRIRTFVVAVLEDEASACAAADVIELVVEGIRR
jgi:hypothetical protein